MAKERAPNDFYPSPPWCFKALLHHLYVFGADVLLEPAYGDGRIYDAFPEGNERKWAELSEGRDYLHTELDYSADIIITNPPFSHALEFIRTALSRDLNKSGTCCMLLRMSMLGSKERADFWREFAPTHLLMLTPRPSFVHGSSDNSEYAWFVWDYGNRLKLPPIWTLKREEFDQEYKEKMQMKLDNTMLGKIKARLKERDPQLKGKALNQKALNVMETLKARKAETIA